MSFYRGTGDVDSGATAGRVLKSNNNLSDVDNAATARTNLGLNASTGASSIGADDGSSGSLWTTVQGFINKILSSAGASVVGFIQAGAGAVATTIQDALQENIRVTQYMTLAQKVDALLATPTLDLTSAIQACVDANKGKEIVFPATYKYLHAGVLLDGATYNGTTLVFEGEPLLKPAPTVGTANFQGACWAGIIFHSTDSCSVRGRVNGNRTAQQDKEQTYCICLAGNTNFKIPYLFVREIRGDGVYVSQATLTANSANSNGLTIGHLHGHNTADDGRNLLSIISCDNVSIGVFESYQIGGTVGGALMPGGLDIESDQTYQSCSNINIGVVNVVTAGANGCGISGQATALTATQNISIASVTVVNTSTPTVADGLGNITQTNNHVMTCANCTNVTIGSLQGKLTNAYGDALIVSNADKVTIRGRVEHVREGVRIGDDVWDVTGVGVTNADIDVQVVSTSRYGFKTGKVASSRIKGKVITPLVGYYAGSLFAVYSRDYTQTNLTYSVDVPYDANWTRAYRNDASAPATFTNTKIANCDVSPGASWAGYIIIKDMAVPISNVVGYTDGPFGIPTGGPHIVGTYIQNAAATVPGVAVGWECIVSGTPGTWVPVGIFPGVNADGDGSLTLTAGSSVPTRNYSVPITALRTVTLSTTGAWNGAKFRIIRSAACTGAFNIDVGTGPLKSLTAAGQWCDVEYNGSAWVLAAYGTL